MEQATRELAELEKLNYHIIQRMRTGIILINHAFKILIINASARRLLGIAEQTETTLLTAASPILSHKVTQWQQQNNTYSHAFKNQPTSTEINAHMADLTPSGNILIFLDDTSRMTQQAQQLKLASLGQLTAAIAHELRNPLGAISHAAQLLAESSTIKASDARLTQIIEDQSKRVNQIVENVLELSRRRTAILEPLDMHSWLPKFLNDYPSDAITLQLPSQALVMRFDPSQLSQVLHNLLENALRYSPTINSPVPSKDNQSPEANIPKPDTTQLDTTQPSRVLLRGGENPLLELPFLEIIDNGPGVADAQIQHLFEPFFTTEAKGTGLGLYICRELCQANYANLDYIPRVECTPAAEYPQQAFNGACFRITFAHPNKQLTH